eukprot:scaffold230_cov150-Isochrysis_galbana.AAC.1
MHTREFIILTPALRHRPPLRRTSRPVPATAAAAAVGAPSCPRNPLPRPLHLAARPPPGARPVRPAATAHHPVGSGVGAAWLRLPGRLRGSNARLPEPGAIAGRRSGRRWRGQGVCLREGWGRYPGGKKRRDAPRGYRGGGGE